jgi:hypothetical protein
LFCFEKERRLWKELLGLRILPMMDGSLGVVGKVEGIIAGREQQLLLPNLRARFLHPRFVQGCDLVKLGGSGEGGLGEGFLSTVKLRMFDLKLLSENVGALLPRQWANKNFVKFGDMDGDGSGGVRVSKERGPNSLWLKIFWSVVKIYR